MKKYLIVVEGKADAIFFTKYLYFIYKNNTNFIKSPNPQKILKGIPISIFENPIVKILISGGCTNIKQYKTPLMEHQDNGYKVIFIQDADDPTKDYGGVEQRMLFLEKQKNELGVDFDIFLFPNQSDNGDLETLLLSLVIEDKYDPFFRYYSNYIKNTSELSEGSYSSELLDNKLRVYNYCQVYYGMDKAKEENREYDIIYWDLNNNSLKPLLLFLMSIINLEE